MGPEVSEDEVRKRFLEYLCSAIDSASKMEGKTPLPMLLEQFTFQLLVLFDQGRTTGRPPHLPAFILAPARLHSRPLRQCGGSQIPGGEGTRGISR